MNYRFFTGLILLTLTAACAGPDTNTPVDQQLVYLAVRDNGYDLFLNNQEGTQENQLTTQPGFDWGPRWWAKQNGILHYSQDTAGNFSHKLITVAGEEIPYDFKGLTDFIVSPNGRLVAYTKKVDDQDHVFIYYTNPDIDTHNDVTPFPAYFGRPKWSPDGKKLLMVSDMSGSQELYLYDEYYGELDQLTEGEGRAKYATWSPDGKKIAFTREVLEAPKKDHDIYILDLKTREITQLTDTPFGEQEISWSPMGDKIAYHGTIDGKDDIYTIDLETKEVKKITQGQGYHGEPAWIPIYQQ